MYEIQEIKKPILKNKINRLENKLLMKRIHARDKGLHGLSPVKLKPKAKTYFGFERYELVLYPILFIELIIFIFLGML